MALAALGIALSYLLGSIPWGVVLVRAFKGVDVRAVGSGNIGATNASRAGGRAIGIAVFALDLAKGWAPVALVAPAFLRESGWGPVACGAAAVLGHCFPVWLAFHGGKGVATGCGAMLALDPIACAIGGVVWVAVVAATRYVGLSSIAMGIAFPVASWWRSGADAVEPTAGAALLALLIAVRHRSNMARMLAGTEPRLFDKRAKKVASRG
jgi:glycerol-3-phosphate acyltransferase PlsY